MASASLRRTPRPAVSGRRHTVVNCSNSSAIASAVCSGQAVGVALGLGAVHRRGDDVHAEAAELVLHRGEARLVAASWSTATMMPMFCLNMFQ